MKASKIINLVGVPKIISAIVSFPLSEQTISDIDNLKLAFRNSFVEHKVYSLGMAAPQINVFKRFFIMPKSFSYGTIRDFKKLKQHVRQFHVYINPKIIEKSKEINSMDQYCLSVGMNEYSVNRPKIVSVQYQNQNGEIITQQLDQIRSRVYQHQYDHLQGILMTQLQGSTKIQRSAGRRN